MERHPRDLEARVAQLEEILQRIAAILVKADGALQSPPSLLPQGGEVTKVNPHAFPAALQEKLSLLSVRERQVLQALLTNKRVPMIARSLFISEHTVRNHLKSVYRKVGVHSQAELLELFDAAVPER
jgi:DNA-binding CsgD family transcriptional regulator